MKNEFAIRGYKKNSSEEINALALATVVTDENGVKHVDNDVFGELCEAFGPLFINISNRYYVKNHSVSSEDIHQEARMAIYYAVLKYSPERGVDFSAYAATVVHFHMVTFLRKLNKQEWEVSLDVDDKDDEKYGYSLEPSGPEDYEPEYAFLINNAIIDLRNSLKNERHKKVLDLYVLENRQNEIAACLGVSESSVNKDIKKIFRKAETMYGRSDEIGPKKVRFVVPVICAQLAA